MHPIDAVKRLRLREVKSSAHHTQVSTVPGLNQGPSDPRVCAALLRSRGYGWRPGDPVTLEQPRNQDPDLQLCSAALPRPRHWLDHRLGAAHTLLAQGHPLHLWGQQL